MSTDTTARQPKGVPIGGQYARTIRSEAGTVLVQDQHVHPMPDLMALTPATRRVLDSITAAGGHPYLVGGCVRDALLSPGGRPKDVDVEVFGLEMGELHDALAKVAHVDEVGKDFAVLTIRSGLESFDVALPRRDTKTSDGHRGFTVVADPYASLPEASARRDFTVNALMWDPRTGDVIDCWGGLDDLDAGVLRHTSDSFGEDPLRVLRAVRFAGRLGFRIDPETAELCRSLAGTYAQIPRERVWKEWHRIVTESVRPSASLAALTQTGWEEHYPQLAALHGVPQDPDWHPEGDVHAHTGLAGDKGAELAAAAGLAGDDRAVVVFAALLHDVGKATNTDPTGLRITSYGHAEAGVEPAKAFLRAIDTPRHIRDRVLPLVREHMSGVGNEHPSPSAVRRLARRLQPATITEWALVVEADKGGRGTASRTGESRPWLDIARRLGAEQKPVSSALRGEHLIAAGMTPGPEFAPILRDAMVAQDDGEFDDEPGAIAWLAARLGR